MVLHIADLLDLGELDHMIKEGRITRRSHPTLPLHIYNYTNRAQFANEWTNAERVCRGLIATEEGEVIARGMPKFFNYGDPHGPEFMPYDLGFCARKEDGSLGIGWHFEGLVGMATRGSFASDQAIKATRMLQPMDISRILSAADQGRTVLFEIVYPDNRIVLEYGDREENILLGRVINATGVMEPHFPDVKLVAAVATIAGQTIPDDEEGYVVHVPNKGMFKLKGETYLNLHKLMFGLTEKAVWEMLQSHNVTQRMQYLDQFPPVTRVWVERKIKFFQDKHRATVAATQALVNKVIFLNDRKSQALWLQQNAPEMLGLVFAYLDGGPERLYAKVWNKIKPEYRPYKVELED